MRGEREEEGEEEETGTEKKKEDGKTQTRRERNWTG